MAGSAGEGQRLELHLKEGEDVSARIIRRHLRLTIKKGLEPAAPTVHGAAAPIALVEANAVAFFFGISWGPVVWVMLNAGLGLAYGIYAVFALLSFLLSQP